MWERPLGRRGSHAKDKDGFVNYLWFEIDQKLFEQKCKPKILKPHEYTIVNNDWYNLGVLMYELLLNLNPENFKDKEGKLKYPRFIEISEEIKEFIEKLMSMKNENDELTFNIEEFNVLHVRNCS